MKWENDYDLINDLVDMGIFNARSLTKKEFEELSELNKDNDSFIYMNGEYGYGADGVDTWYKEIYTKGMDINDINLKIAINKAKNIRSIKNMTTFFVVLTVLSILSSVIGIIMMVQSL